MFLFVFLKELVRKDEKDQYVLPGNIIIIISSRLKIKCGTYVVHHLGR